MGAYAVTLRKTGPQSGLIFSTGKLNYIKTLKGAGACCAIVADWIATSKKLGRSVRSVDELHSTTTYVMAYAPEDLNLKIEDYADINVVKAFCLQPHELQTMNNFTFSELATYLVTQTGYLWMQLYSPEGQGHSLALSIQDEVFDYFDPNVGLYRCIGEAQFTTYFGYQMRTRYPMLTDFAIISDFA